jgi:hypothetical protein
MRSACTPPLQSDDDHHARSGEIVTPVSGPDGTGVLGRDVSAGDTRHDGCRVQSLRALHTRKKHDPAADGVLRWVTPVNAVDEDAVSPRDGCPRRLPRRACSEHAGRAERAPPGPSPAHFVADRAAPKDPPRGWAWPLSLAPGWLRDAIRCTSA